MNRATFSIFLLALLAHSCIAAIFYNTTKPQHLSRLYRAAVDIAMTCYGDPGSAVGILGDTDGSIVKELRLNHFIPVVLITGSRKVCQLHTDMARSHKLQVFIIAVNSANHFLKLLCELMSSVWSNNNANFVIVDTEPDPRKQCTEFGTILTMATHEGSMLNVQFICRSRRNRARVILTSNPFMRRAPEVWTFVGAPKVHKHIPPSFMYARIYRKGGLSCEFMNFAKTENVGGYPLFFITKIVPAASKHDAVFVIPRTEDESASEIMKRTQLRRDEWFIDNIVKTLNVSAVVSNKISDDFPAIVLGSSDLSSMPEMFAQAIDTAILSRNQMPLFAVTQHTGHLSQLNKILTVIDEKSRIGMWLVYLITFLFFKLFLRQAVMPALLNLVRLTCGTGLTTLPQNLAPTIYLACLFMFVVTLQGIYTGNLATLLTTTIPYPNVQKREHIAKLGYTLYAEKDMNTKLLADPILDGHFVEISQSTDCIEYVLSDPLAVCVIDPAEIIYHADKWNLHVSEEPLVYEYQFRQTGMPYLFNRRIQGVLTTLFESGLNPPDEEALQKYVLKFVDDDEVKKNTERRVMTLDDLSFAFVILGVGLLCSFICFIAEIVFYRIRLKNAKRRDRVNGRAAWG